MKKKKWTGVNTAQRKKRQLKQDTYMADVTDLKAIRKIAKEKKCSKGSIVRFGVKLAMLAHAAHANGQRRLIVPLTDA